MAKEHLKIKYIGGPTALLEFGGLRLLTDPTLDPPSGDHVNGPVTLRKNAGPAIAPEEVGDFGYVLRSHDHRGDNFDRAGREIAPKAGEAALTTREGAPGLGGKSRGLNPWQTIEMSAPAGVCCARQRRLHSRATPCGSTASPGC
ncbi:MAG TPA: hypothetical protein VN885_10545 [Candidatus Acidoferrales bacterium]|nr:hypothetical protein [Candidatus Acidoferrales bacterium]